MKNGAVDGMSYSDTSSFGECIACLKGKQTGGPYNQKGQRATKILEVVHGDLTGPMKSVSIGGRFFTVCVR